MGVRRVSAMQPFGRIGKGTGFICVGAALLAIGGAACADATARVNLNLLWQSLDSLPNAEQDLLGPALDEALSKLTGLTVTQDEESSPARSMSPLVSRDRRWQCHDHGGLWCYEGFMAR